MDSCFMNRGSDENKIPKEALNAAGKVGHSSKGPPLAGIFLLLPCGTELV